MNAIYNFISVLIATYIITHPPAISRRNTPLFSWLLYHVNSIKDHQNLFQVFFVTKDVMLYHIPDCPMNFSANTKRVSIWQLFRGSFSIFIFVSILGPFSHQARVWFIWLISNWYRCTICDDEAFKTSFIVSTARFTIEEKTF